MWRQEFQDHRHAGSHCCGAQELGRNQGRRAGELGGVSATVLHSVTSSLFILQKPLGHAAPTTHHVEPSAAESVPNAMNVILDVAGNRHCADCSSTGELQLEPLHLHTVMGLPPSNRTAAIVHVCQL